MAINSRSKGQRGEREVRDILQKVVDEVASEKKMLFAPEVKRNLMQSMEGGHDLVGIPGVAVEVKFCENPQVDKWWEQTLKQASRDGGQPVLIYRKTRNPWQVVMLVFIPCGDEHLTCRATISLSAFLDWLHLYLMNSESFNTKK